MVDCIEGVRQIDVASLDLVLTDPPYFDHVVYSEDAGNISRLPYHDFMPKIAQLWVNLEPKIKDGGILCFWVHDIFRLAPSGEPYLYPFHADLIRDVPAGLQLRNIIIWDRYIEKPRKVGQPRKGNANFMYIVVFSKGKTRFESAFDHFYQNQVWHLKTTPSVLGSKKLYEWAYNVRHSGKWYAGPAKRLYKLIRPWAVKNKYDATDYVTQSPEELVEMILDRFSAKGDTVCDPFLGSGTTLKVAQRMRRQCIGFEINRAVRDTILRRAATTDVHVLE